MANGELTGTYTTVALQRAARRADRGRSATIPAPVASSDAFDRSDLADIPDILRGQVVVTERDAAGGLLAATGVQTAGRARRRVLRRRPTRPSAPRSSATPSALGLGADRAHASRSQLFDTPDAGAADVPMERDDRTGVWSVRGDRRAGPASTTGTG